MAHMESSSSLEELLQKVKERFQAGERGHLAQIGELNLYGQEVDGKPKLCGYLRVDGVEYSGGGEEALALLYVGKMPSKKVLELCDYVEVKDTVSFGAPRHFAFKTHGPPGISQSWTVESLLESRRPGERPS